MTTYAVTVTAQAGGTATASVNAAAAGGAVTITATPDSEHDFAGWTDGNGNVGGDLSSAVKSFTMPAGAVSFTAVFVEKTAPRYAITVAAGTGQGNVTISGAEDNGNGGYRAAAGRVISVTCTPGTGHTFGGLTVTAAGGAVTTNLSGGTSTFTMPSEAVSISATFTAQSWAVTLEKDGGTVNTGDVTSYTYGVGATLPTDVTKTATAQYTYTFAGWFTAATGGSQVTAISTTDTGVKTFYARWTPVVRSYGITSSAGSNGSLSVTVNGTASTQAAVGSVVTLTITPNTGYELDTISVSGAGGAVTLSGTGNTRTFTMPTEAVTASVTFKAATYTVGFSPNSGNALPGGNSRTYTYGTGLTLPTNVTKDSTAEYDYTFAGWFTEASGGTQVTAISSTDYGDKFYYAHWNMSARTYSITYVTEGGTINDSPYPTSYTYNTSTTTTLPTDVTRTGTAQYTYTFDGWYIAATGGMRITSFSNNTTGNKTYYAHWTATPRSYGITLSAGSNGSVAASVSGSAVTQAAVGATVTLTATPDTGYELDTLSVSGAGGAVDLSGTGNTRTFTMPAEAVTVNATFQVMTWSVTLERDGGTINAGNVTSYTYGVGATLPTAVTKAQTAEFTYAFDGWYTAATGGTQVTAISTTDTGAKTFYAHWTASRREYNVSTGTITHGSISIHLQGQTGAITTAPNGSTVVIDNITPETNYRLKELYVELAGYFTRVATWSTGDTSLSFTMPTSNVTVTAVFELDAYTITVSDTSGCSSSVSSPTVGSFSTTSGTAVVGETVTVTITRSSGHGKLSLSVAGQSVVMDLSNDDSTYTYQFTMPSNSVGISIGGYSMSPYFHITPAATVTNGTVTAISEGLPDSTRELTVTPNTGYELDTLTVTKVMPSNVQVGAGYSTTVPLTLKAGTDNVYTFSMPPMDVTYSATFKNATYGITYETDGGTIQDATYATSYVYGTGTSSLPATVTKAQTAQYTYAFTGWFTAATGGTEVTAIGTTETGAKTLYAHWTQTPRSYPITLPTVEHGSVAAYVNGTSATTAWYGDTVVVTVTPDDHYRLVGSASGVTWDKYHIYTSDWTTVAVATANNATFTMPAEQVWVGAQFELDTYRVSVSSQGGTVQLSSPTIGTSTSSQVYPLAGETVTVTMTRGSGKRLTTFTVGGNTVSANLSSDNSTYTYQFTMPQNSVAVEMYATWSSGATGVTVNSMSHGSVTGSSLSSKAPDSTVELTVTPDAGFRLGTISVAKVSTTTTSVAAADLLITPTLKNGTTNVYTFTMPPTDATVSATFVKAVTGVTLNSTAETIDVDEDVTLIATVAPTDAANKNVTWSSGDEDVATVTQNATNGLVATVTGVSAGTTDITVTTEDGSFTATCAVTVSAPAVTLTIDCGTGGTATASPTTPQAGDTVVLTITPNSGKMPVVAIADAGGQSIAVTENGTFSFTMPARSVTATVTFVNTKMYYTSNDSTHTITIYRTQDAQNTREEIADWYEFPSTYGADSVVFAEAVYPTSTEQWFSAGTCEIENIENLHTENVTSMKEMFKDFEGMTTLDLSSFDTSGVTDMSGMFQSCTASTIDVSSFDTSAVVDMQAMLYDCNAVVDISGFDTSSVENMSQMFGQWASGDLDLTNFDTSSVTTMFGMFEDCSTLTSLDLSSFDTANVTDMACMFDGCSALTMITVSDSFDVTNVEDSGDMFAGCTALTGGNGTGYSGSHTDKGYARIDGTNSQPGYFTDSNASSGGSGTSSTMMVNSTNSAGNSLYDFFYTDVNDLYGFDDDFDLLPEMVSFSKSATAPNSDLQDDYNIASNDSDEPVYVWYEPSTKAVKWYSVAETVYLEENLAYMFDMSNWYDESPALTTVDFTGLDMSNVKRITGIFRYCDHLTSVTWGTGEKATIDSSVTVGNDICTASELFYCCESLQTIDLSPFDFSNCDMFENTFYYCRSLTTIYVDDGVNIDTTLTGNLVNEMFDECISLVGGNGTQYNESHIDISYARLDGGPGSATPGYFTAVGSGSGGTTGHSLTAAGNLSANMTFYVDDSEVTEADEDDRVEIHIPQTAFGSGEVLMSLSINSGAVMAHLDFTQFPGVNGNESGTDFVYWFTMPDADATVTATKDSPEYGLPDYISFNLPYGYNGTYAENGIGVMMGATDTAASLINGGYNSVDGIYGYEFSVSSYDLMFGSRYDFVIEVPDGCSITSISGESDYLHYEAIDETHYAGYLTVPEVEEDYIWLVVTLNE